LRALGSFLATNPPQLQAEPDDGHRKYGNPDNLNPKDLGHGTLSRMIRLRSKQRNGPEPEAKKPDLNIQAELFAC
jgi:hypothetical protein